MGGAKGYGDMTGQRFGRWTVLGMTARTSTDGHKRTACLCRCDCGTERVVYAQSLRGGLTKSCGCAKPVPSAGRRPKAEKKICKSCKLFGIGPCNNPRQTICDNYKPKRKK